MITPKYLLIIVIAVVFMLLFTRRKKNRYQNRRRTRNNSAGEKTNYYQRTRFDYREAHSAEEKGAEGELFVARSELGRLPQDLFSVFNNVILPTAEGTSQIDHVVVADQGIFVVETKNYQGTIYGNDRSSEWHQYLGENEYPFHNPLHQNYGHLKSLSNILQLPERLFVPIVVFPNQTKLNIETQNAVLHSYELADYIRNYISDSSLTEEQIQSTCEVLSKANGIDPAVRKQHVQQVQEIIREKNEKIAAGICPRCGGKLVLRNGKYGSFYGCSNYPQCKYTKQQKA